MKICWDLRLLFGLDSTASIIDNRHLYWYYSPSSREIDYREAGAGHCGSGAPVSPHLEYYGDVKEEYTRGSYWLTRGWRGGGDGSAYSLWDIGKKLNWEAETKDCEICLANQRWIDEL